MLLQDEAWSKAIEWYIAQMWGNWAKFNKFYHVSKICRGRWEFNRQNEQNHGTDKYEIFTDSLYELTKVWLLCDQIKTSEHISFYQGKIHNKLHVYTVRAGHVERYQLQSYRIKPFFVTL
jgi:hypothetical protein